MIIDLFLNYLRNECNRSVCTVELYETILRQFELYFREKDCQLSWISIDGDVIRDWMELQMDKGKSAATVNLYLSAVRSFFRFALSRNLVDKDPAHAICGPRKDKPLPMFLRESEMEYLLNQDKWDDSFSSLRARTILLLFYECGLRLAELIALDDKDIDFRSMQLKVTGKRDKQRIVPFGEELSQELGNYIQSRDEKLERVCDALFVNDRGSRISRNQVYNLVRKHLSEATTMMKRSPHVLRHTFATNMMNHGAGLESIKMLLGHESLNTTEVYTHTTFEQLKRVYNNAHPRA